MSYPSVGMERMLTKLLTKKLFFKFNRSGYYYFSRCIPADLVHHYPCPRIFKGLRTNLRDRQSLESSQLRHLRP